MRGQRQEVRRAMEGSQRAMSDSEEGMPRSEGAMSLSAKGYVRA